MTRRSAIGAALTLAVLATFARPAAAQNTYTWSTTTTSNAWLNSNNWTGGPASTFAGADANAVTTADGNAGDVAQIGAVAFSASTLGINFNNTGSNTGVGSNGNANGQFTLGAIDLLSTLSKNFTLGKSDTSTFAANLQLNGVTLGGVDNVVVRNASANNLTIAGFAGGSGTAPMALQLVNATVSNVVINGAGNVTVSANITETGGSRKLGVLGTGTGDVVLSGTNTFTGGIDVSGSGKLRLGAAAALPTTGDMAVSGDGRLRFAAAGTYGANTQTLTLTPNGTTNPAVDLQNSNIAVVFNPNVVLAADSRIEANGATANLTFAGNLSGAGTLLKQAGGTLTLSGTANTATGGTTVGNGTIVVSAGSQLPTGPLTLAQTSTNNTAVTLNNLAQAVGYLSTAWTATTSTQTQQLTLVGTALTVNQTAATTFGTGAVPTLTGTITGTGSVALAATSTGTLTLTGANTYAGGTTVAGGTLLANTPVSGTDSATGTGQVLVTGGTLGGTGQLAPTGGTGVTVQAGGTLKPGAGGTGTLTVAAPTGFATGSTFAVQLTGAANPASVAAGSGGSSGGTLPTPAFNTFLDATGATSTLIFSNGMTVAVDGTGAAFTPGVSYSYAVARVATAGNLTLGGGFTFSTTGFAAQPGTIGLSTAGDGVVYLDFTAAAVPVPP
jgi:autotransporter-associated beta strand protein